MTRRITLTMVAVVAGALLVASVATLLLSRAADRRDARRELGLQARRLAEATDDPGSPPVLAAVRIALRLEGDAVLRFGPGGRTVDRPPAGITLADLSLERLGEGRTVTGTKGSLVFAAAPARRGGGLLVVVLTRRVGGGGVGPLILLVALVTLAAAGAVATDLGRRLVRPLREAQDATKRIAAGDLATRVPVQAEDGEELAGLARSINAMAAGLERSRRLERQFLMSVSHDLRTPLTSIRGYAEALSEGKAPDPAQAASVIRAEARRLERLVADLLELARLGARQFSLDLRRTDVAEVVADTAEGFRPAADAAGVSLEIEVPEDGDMSARADPDRLAQVVANLVENALAFARSSVTVGARAETDADGAGQVALWVEDDGPGIASEDVARVFEPFYRSTAPPARPVGTGLGLAIVRELVEAMDGSVRAQRAGGSDGTRMAVLLPAWAAAG